MLKRNIIRKNHEFQAIIKAKKQIISPFLIFYYCKNESHLRVGISVSKKFLNAVNRNRQRRQVRSILDQLNFYAKKYDIIIILRKSFLDLDFLKKSEKIQKMFRKLELNAK